jgi:putative peptidoglycan lipid II flippase
LQFNLNQFFQIRKQILLLWTGSLIGKLLGFLRDFFVVNLHGLGSESDNILLILIVPDYLNSFLSWSIIVNIFLPTFILNNESEKYYKYLIKILIRTSILIYCILTFLILISTEELDWKSIFIINMSFFFNVLFGLTLLISQSRHDFIFTSFANTIYNLGIIIGIYFSFISKYVMPIMVLIISFIRYQLSKIYNDYKHKLKMVSVSHTKHDFQIVFVFLALSAFSFNSLIDKTITTTINLGSLTLFSIAEKLFLFPLTILIITYLKYDLPILSKKILKFKKFDLAQDLIKKSTIFFFCFLTFYIYKNLCIELLESYNLIPNINFQYLSKILDLFNYSTIQYCLIIYLSNIYIIKKDYKNLLLRTGLPIILKIPIYYFGLINSIENIVVTNNILLTLISALLLFNLYKYDFVSFIRRRPRIYNPQTNR